MTPEEALAEVRERLWKIERGLQAGIPEEFAAACSDLSLTRFDLGEKAMYGRALLRDKTEQEVLAEAYMDELALSTALNSGPRWEIVLHSVQWGKEDMPVTITRRFVAAPEREEESDGQG
jgi:hypothetical protein